MPGHYDFNSAMPLSGLSFQLEGREHTKESEAAVRRSINTLREPSSRSRKSSRSHRRFLVSPPTTAMPARRPTPSTIGRHPPLGQIPQRILGGEGDDLRGNNERDCTIFRFIGLRLYDYSCRRHLLHVRIDRVMGAVVLCRFFFERPLKYTMTKECRSSSAHQPMTPIEIIAIVFSCLFGGSLLGISIRPLLPEQHLNTESKDVIKLGVGLVGTMAALVLGLLVASAKGSFDARNGEITQLAANSILLDRVLAHYGPETRDMRGMLKAAVARMIVQTWSESGSTSASDPKGRTRRATLRQDSGIATWHRCSARVAIAGAVDRDQYRTDALALVRTKRNFDFKTLSCRRSLLAQHPFHQLWIAQSTQLDGGDHTARQCDVGCGCAVSDPRARSSFFRLDSDFCRTIKKGARAARKLANRKPPTFYYDGVIWQGVKESRSAPWEQSRISTPCLKMASFPELSPASRGKLQRGCRR